VNRTAPVLVTGAAGFVGHATAHHLLARGEQVIGIDVINNYYDPALKAARLATLEGQPNFRFERMDIANAEALAKLIASEGIVRVIHLAAQAGVRYSIENPFAYQHSNLTGHLSVIEACRHAQDFEHLVYASSSSVYGLPQTGLRFFTVYGPWGRPDMAYFSFTQKIMAGQPIEVFGEGRMARDFTYIDDIVDGIVGALDRPPSLSGTAATRADLHRILNIGDSHPVGLMEMITSLERALGRTAEKVMRPMQPGDVTATYADVSRLNALTGYRPKVMLDEGLARFADWYRSYYGQ
jgi:UDP-glucuronate 4-epimerase